MARTVSGHPQNLKVMAAQVARKYRIPVGLFLGLIQQESSWNPNAVSPAGAIGLTQLMPGTAAGMKLDPHNIRQNLIGGASYLRAQLDAFKNVRLALAAYNAGPYAVRQRGESAAAAGYVDNILRYSKQFPVLSASPDQGMSNPSPTPAAPQKASQAPLRAIVSQQVAPLPPMFAQDMAPLAPIGKMNPVATLPKLGNLQQVNIVPPKVTTTISFKGASKASGGQQLPPLTVQHEGTKPSAQSNEIIDLARNYLGTKYVFGGASPKTGFDCSGFVQWLYGQVGIHLPRTTFEQVHAGTPVGFKDLKPGDIVFFNTENDPRGPSHEGLYIGGGRFIQAPHTGDVVKISNINDAYYRTRFVTARRVSAR